MSDPVEEHPYLGEQHGDDHQHSPLWNTNPHFPTIQSIEREQVYTKPAKPVDPPEHKESSELLARTPTTEAVPSALDTEMLSSFSQWLLSLKPPAHQGEGSPARSRLFAETPGKMVSEPDEPKKKKKKKKKKKLQKDKKRKESKSGAGVIPDDAEIVSDTLAELIASQGHIDEAIRMYHKLVGLYPERAPFYLQRITELRQGKE